MMPASSEMRIAFILLAHEDAPVVLHLAQALLDADPDCQVVVHYDRNSPDEQFQVLKEAAEQAPRLHLLLKRVACSWGEFGLVEAVVRAMRYIRDQAVACDREMLISASCWPVKPLAQLKYYLAERPNVEFIVCEDEQWMLDGLREERHQFWYWFNFRKHKRLFETSLSIQRFLGIRRRLPAGLVPRYGSQWWCLTRGLCEMILDFIDKNPKYYEFFRWSFIPDETFFQSITYHLVQDDRISNHSLTFHQFSPRGKPLVFYDEHLTMLVNLNFFFARKISSEAKALQKELAVRAGQPCFDRSLEGIGGKHEVRWPVTGERLLSERPGQIFGRDARAIGWPGALRKSHRYLIVLYGPGSLLRLAARVLTTSTGLEVLGRVFDHSRVDFGNNRTHFKGLKRDDVAIRDFDPSLYLSRLVDRCVGLPVIALSPIDSASALWGLLESENCILIALTPHPGAETELERIFFALSAAERNQQVQSDLDRASFEPAEKHLALREEIDSSIKRTILDNDRFGIEKRILSPDAPPNMVRCHFGAFGAKKSTSSIYAREEQLLLSSTGGAAAPLLQGLAELRLELARLSPKNLFAELPIHWQDYFAAALRPVTKLARSSKAVQSPSD